MIQSLITLAQAAAPAGEAAPSGIQSLIGNPLVMMVLFVVIFWVVLIRPQKKAQKEHQARLKTLKRGDKIVTNAGIHGMVEKAEETTVELKIAEGTIITLEKNAVAAIIK